MPRRRLPFIGASRQGRYEAFQGQRLINWAPHIEGQGARSRMALHPDPGLKANAVVGAGPHRSTLLPWNGHLYGVSGRTVFSTTGTGTPVTVGTIAAGGQRVSMAAGRDMILIVDGTAGYTWNGTTLASVSDGDFFAGTTTVTYLDGYFIAHTGNRYQISALDDATSWSAIAFKSAEGSADDIAAVATNNQDLYLVGTETTEVHYNTGTGTVPFAPYGNSAIGYGTPAPHSVSWALPGLFFLAQTANGEHSVVRVVGLEPQVVSDPDLEWQIGQMMTVEDAIGWVYQQAGRWWYQLTFPTEMRTFVLGIESGLWHERRTYGKGRHRANSHGVISRKHLVGDFESGALYELDFATGTDGGSVIERIRITPDMHADGDVIEFDEVLLAFNSGEALLPGASPVSGDGSDPEVSMRFSDDGGRTWGPWMNEPIGKIGEYDRRVSFNALGDATKRRFEIKVTSAVPVALADAYAEISGGAG